MTINIIPLEKDANDIQDAINKNALINLGNFGDSIIISISLEYKDNKAVWKVKNSSEESLNIDVKNQSEPFIVYSMQDYIADCRESREINIRLFNLLSKMTNYKHYATWQEIYDAVNTKEIFLSFFKAGETMFKQYQECLKKRNVTIL